MDQKTRKIVIAGSLLTLGGIGAYFGYQAWKKWKDEQDAKDAQLAATLANINTGGGNTGGGGESGGGGGTTTQTDRPENILAFQQFVINTIGDKTILGGGGASGFGDDGIWGRNTKKAWAIHKDAYLKSIGGTTSTGKDYDTISANLKPIAKALGKGNALLRYGTNQEGIDYLKFTSNTTGNKYYWFASGRFKVWTDDGGGKNLSYGDWASKGKKVMPDGGPRKGETITKDKALTAAYESTIDRTPAMSSSLAKKIADNLFTAMDGGGTSDAVLWSNINLVNNSKQWRQVYDKFGKRQGYWGGSKYTLDQWLHYDLEYASERRKLNKKMKAIGAKLRLQEKDMPSSKIEARTV
jgi:hypothetical protein